MLRSLQDHFLIAMPAMGDPNFNETVTYVCRHDESGALGVVVNRLADLSLGEVFAQLQIALPDRDRADDPVLRGGPVEPQRGFVLHPIAGPYEHTLEGGTTIRVTVSPDILAAIARGDGPEHALLALGYAGWGAGQLEAELRANAWLTAPAEPAILFDTPIEQRWAAALGLPGVDIHSITNYAGHA